jgi:hypothetical protein
MVDTVALQRFYEDLAAVTDPHASFSRLTRGLAVKADPSPITDLYPISLLLTRSNT